MSVKRQPRGSITREAILDAGETVFAESGFDGARLEDIAGTIGLKRPSLLYHFPTKAELYDAVEERIFKRMHDAAEMRIAKSMDAKARLLAHLDGWLDFLVSRPTAARLILRLICDRHIRPQNPIEFSKLVLEDMDATLGRGVEAGEFRPISTGMFLNAVAGGILLYVCGSPQLIGAGGFAPDDPAKVAEYRDLLHRLAMTAIS